MSMVTGTTETYPLLMAQSSVSDASGSWLIKLPVSQLVVGLSHRVFSLFKFLLPVTQGLAGYHHPFYLRSRHSREVDIKAYTCRQWLAKASYISSSDILFTPREIG